MQKLSISEPQIEKHYAYKKHVYQYKHLNNTFFLICMLLRKLCALVSKNWFVHFIRGEVSPWGKIFNLYAGVCFRVFIEVTLRGFH